MTLDDLIALLEDARDETSGDTEIAVAFQPTYPLRATLRGIATPNDLAGEDVDIDNAGPAGAVWLVISDGVGYDVPPCLWDIARH